MVIILLACILCVFSVFWSLGIFKKTKKLYFLTLEEVKEER